MSRASPWVTDRNVALLTDLYELTMLQAYWREEMFERAVFSLFVRRLPPERNYLLACGLEDVLHYLENLRFDDDALAYLSGFDAFSDDFLHWLGDLRFTGDVHAVPEGTPVFPDEPFLEIEGPLPEAQLAETFIMNQVHLQTVLASKAARVVEAAQGRAVVDFGLRRMHGTDAGMKAARSLHVAGITATSNVLAGRAYGVPVTGTMAHSYVQAHDDEKEAFRAFAELYPETVLLVDTYDTLEGIRTVIELAAEMGDRFTVRAVRLDSGDLSELAKAARVMLDDAGLERVEIFASGGLEEHEIARLLGDGAPIDGFGVGTGLGVSRDAPALDIAYKLTAYGGRGRLKLSPGKKILPGRKQVYRIEEDGRAVRDVLTRADASGRGARAEPAERSARAERSGEGGRSDRGGRAGLDGEDRGRSAEGDARPLLEKVMEGGERLPPGRRSLDEARRRAREELARLPDRIRSLERADPPYPVKVSERLRRYQEEVVHEVDQAREDDSKEAHRR